MKTQELTFDELNAVIAYDPETGVFTWKDDVSNNVKKGSVAGTFKNCRHRTTGQTKTYLYIRYSGREMVGSRVAWLLSYGEWPVQSVTFSDGDTTNLRLSNLKLSKFKSNVVKQDGRRNYRMSKDAQRHYGLMRYYGISINQYAEMYQEQDGKCAICGTTDSGSMDWCADHDHKTGQKRGLLCHKCNTGLGLLKDDIDTLCAAIDYLKKYQEEKAE